MGKRLFEKLNELKGEKSKPKPKPKKSKPKADKD